MKNHRQSRWVNYIVSPYGLAIISYAFFLFACLLPPSLYSYYMQEPDLMFLDPAAILLFTLCVVSFMLGAGLVGWLFPVTFVDLRSEPKVNSIIFLLGPLALGAVFAITTTLYLVIHNPIILAALFAQQGDNVKELLAFDIDGHFAIVPLVTVGITWWAYWRYSGMNLRGWKKQMVRLFLFASVLTIIISSTLTLSRSILMLGISGLTILLLIRKLIDKKLSARFILRSGLAVAFSIPLLFVTFALLRGANISDPALAQGFLGYTLATYNRLAAVVNGSLHYPYAGHGMYLSGIAAYSRALPFSHLLQYPDSVSVWQSEFAATSRAGLNGNLIWSGAFGYIFSDLGWFSFAFVFGYGILYGIVWSWIKRGYVMGIVLYPWCGFCVLFWLGTNYLLDQPAEIFLVVAIALSVYESIFAKRSDRASNPILRARSSTPT